MSGTLKVGTITTPSGSGNITIPSGVTLLSNTPAFEVNGNGQTNPSIPNNTETKVIFTNEIVDTDSAYNTSDGKFTPQVAGKYYCYARITYNKSGDFDEIACTLKKNGTTFASNTGRNEFYDTLSTYSIQTFNGSSDYLELYTKHQAGGTSDLHSSFNNGAFCVFGAYRIGA
ncbi:complement C1q protein [uncultured Mediterranean phage uvMED]|nr:complement C1q protein [uncultured Mediterranean phage uvMED]